MSGVKRGTGGISHTLNDRKEVQKNGKSAIASREWGN